MYNMFLNLIGIRSDSKHGENEKNKIQFPE